MKLPNPIKPRSTNILDAQMRKGGPMRDKRSKRAEENKNPKFQEEMESKLDSMATCSWMTIHHAIEMLQSNSKQWIASADAWKTLNELRTSIGMKALEPIDFPKWPEYFDQE